MRAKIAYFKGALHYRSHARMEYRNTRLQREREHCELKYRNVDRTFRLTSRRVLQFSQASNNGESNGEVHENDMETERTLV